MGKAGAWEGDAGHQTMAAERWDVAYLQSPKHNLVNGSGQTNAKGQGQDEQSPDSLILISCCVISCRSVGKA